MRSVIDFSTGKTLLTLCDELGQNNEPRKLRKRLKQLRKALGVRKGQRVVVSVTVVADETTSEDPQPEALSPDCSTYGELLNFLATFTGSERSVVTPKHTVKELISALNANEFPVVSSYIHKIGFGVTSKVGPFLEFLSNDPNTLIPAEVQP